MASFAAIEAIQRSVAKTIATSPVGHNLLLIGGFRFRLLDQSARFSVDIDYHWEADLTEKQQELLRLSRRLIIPQTRREFGYEGRAEFASGPEGESASARFVELRLWKHDVSDSQIVIPLEITRIVRIDPATIRTIGGVVYPTPSDTDLIEGKILAIMNRVFLEHRDLVDLFLYGDRLSSDSPRRLKNKFETLQLHRESIDRRLSDLRNHRDYHARAVQAIIDSQLDSVAAAHINAGGGGGAVFNRALQLIESNVRL